MDFKFTYLFGNNMTFADKSDIYVMGYINALLDTQPALIEIAETRSNQDWSYMYELAIDNTGGFVDFLPITERGLLGLRWELEALMERYFRALGVAYKS
jgi:hypothetical protein